ncbi:M23 family metallopeptidase [Brevibacterium casei]|uniref:M23 family metallopeptidase n=1 Tax=Brevibacterium casei TaxID=33889 RepID=UPI000E650CAF|nr:M23 family metallopeptidase [Brevibacterium casei]MBE4696194.1 M23 family metallopeptidase [Brevibacterium casei]MBY3579316.1 M23 family metallopeptidase [Brevibacterium casei]MCT1765477.1 M23 family metallopeptidase [Brevibacterium casei]
MLRKAIAGLAALVLLGPMVVLVSVGLLVNPSAASCAAPGGSVQVGDVPDELTSTTRDGEQVTLGKAELTHAATIIETGSTTEGVGRDGIVIALMAALTESRMRMLANTSAYPESGEYPNDGDGSDNDSLGLFQMRPASGWGTVTELMDPDYQAAAFYGGPDGPNGGSPRGLLDIPGWEQMGKGEAAQSVEVSAYPDRYDNYEPVAEDILTTLTGSGTGSGDPGPTRAPVLVGAEPVESARVVFPLPEGTWVPTSPFGPRTHPITGELESFHTGSDFSAPDGTPILAAADGTVTVAEFSGGYGSLVVIEHRIDGKTLATAYAHSWEHGIHVAPGDTVRAGQHIADVGSSGMSTGPHLHFEVRDGGTDGEYIDPAKWLNDHDAADLDESDVTPPGQHEDCDTQQSTPGDPAPVEGDPDELVDDPTSEGQITVRMRSVYEQTLAAFPESTWACYSPRPGTKSEHPIGRACDVAFGNAIGQYPTPAQLEYGWQVTDWLQEHAEILGVEYLIWQGKIWSLPRADEGWRDYSGGGMHDPGNVTGGHFDHLHITVKA